MVLGLLQLFSLLSQSIYSPESIANSTRDIGDAAFGFHTLLFDNINDPVLLPPFLGHVVGGISSLGLAVQSLNLSIIALKSQVDSISNFAMDLLASET